MTKARANRPPKKHHLVPASYLERFVDERGLLAIFDRTNGHSFERTPESVGYENDFYTVTTETGASSTFVENPLLSEIDGSGTSALSRLSTSFPPNDADRSAIATFAAFQFVRGKHAREGFRSLERERVDIALGLSTADVIRDTLRRHERSHDARAVEQVQQAINDYKAGRLKWVPDRNAAVRAMLFSAHDLIPLLLSPRWVLLRFQAPVLVTSDHPVVALRAGMPTGIASAELVLMPTDPLHVLWVSPANAEESAVEVDAPRAAVINQCVAGMAYRWIYSRPGTMDLAALGLPPVGPRLVTSRWPPTPHVRATKRRRK